MKNIIKEKKGITLIALVITIIVLLILAGVSLGELIGKKTSITESKDKTALSELTKIQQAVIEIYLKYTQLGNKMILKGTSMTYADALSEFNQLGSSESLKVQSYDGISETDPGLFYYKVGPSNLKEMGLENIHREDEYVVNYSTGEVFNISQKKLEDEKIWQDLRKIIPEENIKRNEPMSKHTSFKTGGPAEFYITAKTIEDIQNIFQYAKTNRIKLYIIGNGSNLLVSDEGIKGIVLKIAVDNIETLESDFGILVNAGAGVKTMALAQILKKDGITGFEELAGIPGTIGGANYMNAGAYGKELKDIIVETKVINKETGKIETLKKEEQELKYRSSIFKNKKYIIIETTFNLQRGKPEEIERRMNEFSIQRKEKQPLEYPSAGSTFKRGDGFITAKLIDECGLKGYTIGGAQISEKHAGFIINKGNATSKDILDLIDYTKKKVFEKFGVQIEEEVEII